MAVITKIDFTPEEWDKVTLKTCDNVAEVRYSQRRNRRAHIQKLDNQRYVLLHDKKDGSGVRGEIRAFKRGESRLDDRLSVKNSMQRLRDYLNTNVTDARACRWLCLSYENNELNAAKVYSDFAAFNRKCRKKYGRYNYVAALECQGRGAYHLHCVFIFDKPAPFMANADVHALWGHGFVNIRKLANADAVDNYLAAYLGDATLEELGGLPNGITPERLKVIEVTEGGKRRKKAVVKGARLALMPAGVHLYRISKGIKPPIVTKTTISEAARRLSGWAQTYEAAYHIEDEARGFENIVVKRYYKRSGVVNKRGVEQ